MSTVSIKAQEFKAKLANLNPVNGMYGKAFRIHLIDGFEQKINDIIREWKQSYTSKEIQAAKVVLNKSDTRDYLTLFTQMVTIGKTDDENLINLMVAVKFASVASILPIRYVSARQQLPVAIKLLEKEAIRLATTVNADFAQKLSTLFMQTHVSTNQNVIASSEKIEVDKVRQLYWNKYEQVAKLVSNEIEKITSIKYDEITNKLVKYHVLFNEVSTHINNTKSKTLVDDLGYELLSKNVAQYYNEILKLCEAFEIKEGIKFGTHISEASEKVRLSDLPPLTTTGLISMVMSYVLIIIWAFIILYPLAQMVIKSFDGTRTNTLTAEQTTNDPFYIHYKNLWEQTEFKSWLSNSVIVALWTTLIVVIGTCLLAYAFSRYKFKGRKSSIMTLMLIQMVPSVAALTAFLVIYQMADIKTNTFLIIIYSGGGLTGNTFILRGYFDSIPVDLDEAAKIDGASNTKTFLRILVPLAKPMIALVALWSFVGPFGDVILPNLLNDKTSASVSEYTMAAGLRTLIVGDNVFQFEYLAGAILTALPISIVFIMAQKFLVSGLTAGAVK